MSFTGILASMYMHYTRIPDILGAKGIRWLLILRGLGGFFGVSSMYYSLLYLPLADATVITFLSPVIACAVCAYLLREPFTRLEQIASIISLSGVVLIARPTALFSYFQGVPDEESAVAAIPNLSPLNTTIIPPTTVQNHTVTSSQKVIAVGIALIGVIGGAIVITVLRSIGNKAHPLVTVNYFAFMVVIISGLSCAFVPSVGGFAIPTNLKEWGLLFFLGFCGFTAQTFGAAGLQYEKSSRATNMIYTQMLFALIMDQVFFGRSPEPLSVIGSVLILGSAIAIAFKKSDNRQSKNSRDTPVATDEEIGLMEGEIDYEEDIVMSPIRTHKEPR
jgi:drug/metabolite transporter (DMT)-like permease